MDAFRSAVHRHGLLRALRRSLLGRASKLIDFEICRVEITSGEPYLWPDVVGYDTRIVDEAAFHQHLCSELVGADYRWAFARGDTCSASLSGEDVVGYSFYSSLPTRVRDGITFTFPPGPYVYAFASATAASHRGKRLEQDRWKIARRHRNATTNKDPRIVSYVNVANLESRATGKAVGQPGELIGFIAYCKIAARYRFFASPGCRRCGIRFISTRAS